MRTHARTSREQGSRIFKMRRSRAWRDRLAVIEQMLRATTQYVSIDRRIYVARIDAVTVRPHRIVSQMRVGISLLEVGAGLPEMPRPAGIMTWSRPPSLVYTFQDYVRPGRAIRQFRSFLRTAGASVLEIRQRMRAGEFARRDIVDGEANAIDYDSPDTAAPAPHAIAYDARNAKTAG